MSPVKITASAVDTIQVKASATTKAAKLTASSQDSIQVTAPPAVGPGAVTVSVSGVILFDDFAFPFTG